MTDQQAPELVYCSFCKRLTEPIIEEEVCIVCMECGSDEDYPDELYKKHNCPTCGEMPK